MTKSSHSLEGFIDSLHPDKGFRMRVGEGEVPVIAVSKACVLG